MWPFKKKEENKVNVMLNPPAYELTKQNALKRVELKKIEILTDLNSRITRAVARGAELLGVSPIDIDDVLEKVKL